MIKKSYQFRIKYKNNTYNYCEYYFFVFQVRVAIVIYILLAALRIMRALMMY